ncbi:Imm21 family immunity protein [Streptomyces sp. NPDC001953]
MGGPLIVVPVSVLHQWSGCTEDGIIVGGTDEPDDYDRACAVEGPAEAISLGDAEHVSALVLGDEPATTCYLPEQGAFVRWLGAGSETELVAAAGAVLSDEATPWTVCGDRRPGGSDGLSRGRRRPRRALPGWQGPTGRSPGARGRRTMESPCVLQDRRMLFGGRGPTPPSNRSLIHRWRVGGAGATCVWDLPNRTAAGPVALRRRAGSAGAAERSRRRRRPTPPRITVS